MSIYAISDLHLSFANPKPMDIFGPAWADYAEKLRENWDAVVTDADIVLLPGDLSWAMRLSEATPDFDFVAERPGWKVLIRGNHDYWWHRQATSRIQRIVDRNMTFLQGTSVVMGGAGITGTRGWRVDWETRGHDRETGRTGEWENGGQGSPSPRPADTPLPTLGEGMESAVRDPQWNDRVLQRELAYLERGLQSIPESASPKIAMLHFPPFDERLQPNEFAHLLAKYPVDILVYGHVHLGLGSWLEGMVEGVRYYIVSADVAEFAPQLIVP
ncbi:MAG TPA: metallophosphoesterase [Armatimonadota bacterium]|nr:metallophosphoesterase [Armatimonadota bacterium]